MKLVYICHPYANDPEGNRKKVLRICRSMTMEEHIPIAPQLYFHQFIDEKTQRDLAMMFCSKLVSICQEVWVYGIDITDGMRQEIEEASRQGIPVKFINRWY